MKDKIDAKLATALQQDAQQTAQDLANLLGLSPSQVARRRQKLEADKIIEGYQAKLSAEALGLGVQAFVQVELRTHDPKTAQSFYKLINVQPEIVSAWALTGNADLMLRIYTKTLGSLNTLIHDTLLPHAAVGRVHSQIVMNHIKKDAPLPI